MCSQRKSRIKPVIDIDFQLIDESVKKFKPDYVIDCIGVKPYYYGKRIEEKKNLELTLNSYKELLGIINKYNSRFIFISSGGALYKKNTTQPMSENSEIELNDLYSIANYELEDVIRENTNHLIVRGSNVYGASQRNRERQGLITETFYAAKENQTILIDNLNTEKDYIHVTDFASVILQLMTLNVENNVINIGSGVRVSTKRILSKINNLLKIYDLHVNFVLKESIQPSSIYLDISKLHEIIGYYKCLTLDEGLQINWNLISKTAGRLA